MHKPKYALFFDNHTMAMCPDVGVDFNAGEFAGRISDCGADFVGFHAKCNQGFCYYEGTKGSDPFYNTYVVICQSIMAC
jgi:hypothetical protein